jgi:hypothetical protein
MCVRRIIKTQEGTEVLKYEEDPSAKGIPLLTDVLEDGHPAAKKAETPVRRVSLITLDLRRFKPPKLVPNPGYRMSTPQCSSGRGRVRPPKRK